MSRRPEGSPEFREARVCACGDHGFVGLTRAGVAFVDPHDVPVIAGRRWLLVSRPGVCYAHAKGWEPGNPARWDIPMHRLILGADTPHVDHMDGDGLNNRRANLRACTAAENLRNRRKPRTAKCELKGITEVRGRFVAQITADGQRHYLGSFRDPVEAARAYDRAARDLHGEFARTNTDLGLLPPEAIAAE